jgi:hypothetical protein
MARLGSVITAFARNGLAPDEVRPASGVVAGGEGCQVKLETRAPGWNTTPSLRERLAEMFTVNPIETPT